MTDLRVHRPPLSEACPFCGQEVSAQTPRATNLSISPIHLGSTVAVTAHWECLAPRLAGIAGVDASNLYSVLFEDGPSAA